MRRLIYSLLAVCMVLVAPHAAVAQDTRPRLVVNIVVGSLRANDLTRFSIGFGEGGFKRLMREGVNFTDAEYDYALTTTETGLATLATGAQPSVHGVIGSGWWNHIDNSRQELVTDPKSQPVPFSTGSISCSAYRLHAPTLGDMVVEANDLSKQVTVAIDPASAIILNGKSGVPYWVESNKSYWTTSAAFAEKLPTWIDYYNTRETTSLQRARRWTPIGDIITYLNSEVAVVEGIKGKTTKLVSGIDLTLDDTAYGRMCYTPVGNTMLLRFAEQALLHEDLGSDANPDVLNICLDPSRYIATIFGTESIEYEDMLYRLDANLAEFLNALYEHVGNKRDVVVVLTSDHGTAPSYNPQGGEPRERFNTRQMEVIVNAFLGARYGSGSYVTGFDNNAIYLNHELLNDKKLEIASIQEEVATFLLQMRGISTAITSTELRSTSFAEGRQRLMQQSFFATRSGDVIVDFLPGWFVEDGSCRTSSHAGHRYDRSVPLIISGAGLAPRRVTRTVSMVEVAPTIAKILGVETPWASSARAMVELDK